QDMVNGGGAFQFYHHLLLPNLMLGGVPTKDDCYAALGRADEGNRAQYWRELREMVDALYNVPSIGMWVPFNEAWGQFDAAQVAEWLMTYDPSRVVDHASGWHDQGVGELLSLHIYFRRLRVPRRRVRGRAVI